MRIAQLYHDFGQRGGAERHVETLARSFSDLGHEVTIVSGTPPLGFRGFHLDFSRVGSPWSALRLARWLARERIDVIHAHSRIAAWIASLAVRLHRIPLVVTSHILPAGLKQLSAWGDATICVSQAVRQCLIRNYGVAAHQATVIHNGVEIHNPEFPGAELSDLNCAELREMRTGAEMGLNACPGAAGPQKAWPQPVVSLVARFARGKGHAMFLECATRLLAQGFPGTFLLAGDGPLEAELRARYAHERLVFLGFRKDPMAILARSAASVVCSDREAFPYSVLESLAVGTPVVSTACGGPQEIIDHGRNGYLFPVGDAAALGRLLVTATAPGSGLASRHAIAADCRARFSRRRMLEATLRVYQACVRREEVSQEFAAGAQNV